MVVAKKHPASVERYTILEHRSTYNWQFITSEIKDIERILSRKYPIKLTECYSNTHEGRKRLIYPFEMSDEDYIEQ